VAEWGRQLDTAVSNACICFSSAYVQPSALPLIRFTLVVWTCEQPTDDDIVDAVTAPAESRSSALSNEEEEKEGESTALDLPGHSQGVTALETLQRYLLSVSVTAMKRR